MSEVSERLILRALHALLLLALNAYGSIPTGRAVLSDLEERLK